MMMTDVFTRIDQITPEWLTACLHASGALPQGQVVALSGQTQATIVSLVGRITVEYSPDATSTAPPHLFLKTGSGEAEQHPDWRAEVLFYHQLAPTMIEATAPCFHAAYAEQPARFHLLLADLSPTHSQIVWPLPPTTQQLGQAIDCLAHIHARWWNHPRFGRDVHLRFTPASLAAWFEVWEQRLRQYLDFLDDRLSPRRRTLYKWVLPRILPLLHQRRQDTSHWTLVHQDAHAYNFLFSDPGSIDMARLIDWSTWDIGLGARDLAYLLALHFFPEQRARLEQPMLQRYHASLVAYGVDNYAWDQLWYDYRLFASRNLLVPVEQFIRGVPAEVWWWHAERSVLAFDDLGCAELLS
jgi:hypothetical protein